MDNYRKQTIIEGIIKYLTKSNSLNDKNEIIQSLTQQAKNKKQIKIFSAISLDNNQKEKINSILLQKYPDIKNISYEIDNQLIAGLKIIINDNLIDYSFLGKLNQIQGEMI